MKHFLGIFLFSMFVAGHSFAQSGGMQDDEGKNIPGATGLPLPRFASLRSDEINMRTGPGTRYPIEWVYVREGLPVEITKEFDIWRRVRDWEGSEGWVHKSALTGKRTAIIVGGTKELYKDRSTDAPLMAKIEQGAIGRIVSCDPQWCELKFNDIKGYMPKTDFWGTYQDEVFD